MKNMKLNIVYTAALIILFQSLTGFSVKAQTANSITFSVGDPLQNDMVVQQAKPMKVWGSATAGDEVEIKADWMKS